MTGAIVLVVRRTIKAPVTRVFEAWTRPEHLRRWWGPAPVTCSEAEVDLRVGGLYRIGNLLPDGSVLFIAGAFEIVDPPHRLVYSWQIERAGAAPADTSRVTVRFEPRDGGTEVIIAHEQIDSEATRADHEHGWIGCLDGLGKLFDPAVSYP
ncbi:MAG: SRPBCC domain-containing protein [Polyangiaceae bacterium]